jgi:hypothetical protein
LTVRLPPVTNRTLPLFMCHNYLSEA